jgi:hypothetical protein
MDDAVKSRNDQIAKMREPNRLVSSFWNRRSALLFFLLCWGWAYDLRAVIWDPLSLADLTRKAEVVVQARVLSQQSGRDEAGVIFTQIELRVIEVWKGQVESDPLIVVHGGGRVGRLETVVSGQVRYETGEEVVAFLVRNTRGQAVTLGLAQGKFNVTRESSATDPTVHNLFHGTLPAKSGGTIEAASAHGARLTLAELKRRVKGGAQ